MPTQDTIDTVLNAFNEVNAAQKASEKVAYVAVRVELAVRVLQHQGFQAEGLAQDLPFIDDDLAQAGARVYGISMHGEIVGESGLVGWEAIAKDCMNREHPSERYTLLALDHGRESYEMDLSLPGLQQDIEQGWALVIAHLLDTTTPCSTNTAPRPRF